MPARQEPLFTNAEERRIPFFLLLAFFSIGAVFTVFALIRWPDRYLELADRTRWRMSMPSVGQLQLEATLTAIQLRGDAVGGANPTLLFGDSHLQGLPTSALGERVTNYAIAGEPASRLATRMRRYTSVITAQKVIIHSGGNDLVAGLSPQQAAESVALAIAVVPSRVPVFLVELPPVRGNANRGVQVTALNIELASVCAQRLHCSLIRLQALYDASGQLAAAYAAPDGVHLSAAGYQVLVDALIGALHASNFERPKVILQ